MKFHQLRALIAVADCGSIHEASRELHLTQPAISKALADLERELGAPLLIRSAKGVQLTVFGQSLIRHARAIEQELRHAQEDIATLLGVARGNITVGVTPVTSTGPFADALRQFMASHPQVNVSVREMRPAQIHEGLYDGSLDFGLVSRIGRPNEARFHWEELYTIPTTLAVRTSSTLRGMQTLETLATHPWLSWDSLEDVSSLIGAIFSKGGLEAPTNVLLCTSTLLYVEMASTTDVVSLWSQLPFQLHEYRARLRRIPLSEPLPEMTVGIVCRDLNVATTVALTLIDLIRECSAALTGAYRKAGAVSRVKRPGTSM